MLSRLTNLRLCSLLLVLTITVQAGTVTITLNEKGETVKQESTEADRDGGFAIKPGDKVVFQFKRASDASSGTGGGSGATSPTVKATVPLTTPTTDPRIIYAFEDQIGNGHNLACAGGTPYTEGTWVTAAKNALYFNVVTVKKAPRTPRSRV